MKGLYWNVRELRNKGLSSFFRTLMSEMDFDFVCFQETMLQDISDGIMRWLDPRLARPSSCATSFPLPHDSLGVGKRGFGQVVTQLHQHTSPIYQHVISTFNAYSRGPTYQSLTDIGGGYNLEGVGFPHHTL
jgi:hypothetical protein